MAAAGAGVGAVAGGLAGAFTIVLLAAVAWLWVFGDDPWPGWAEIVIAGAGYTVGLVATVAGVIIGWRRPGPSR